jgi:DNA invertase Pin-like site-specific DNA recombinase
MRNKTEPGTYDLMTGRLLLGYARVSTDDQELASQRDELHAVGCTRIFAEKITGTHRNRPELGRLLDHLRPGDVVTVTRLDRLARNTRDLLDIAERIQEAGAGLSSLAEPWVNTTTPAGRMVLTVFAGIAEFERSLIVERTRSGRVAAKARGVKFGPRPTLTPAQVKHARRLIDQDDHTVKEAAELLGVHRTTLYRAIARAEEVSQVEAKQRGAFQEDALTEADALTAVGQEEARS